MCNADEQRTEKTSLPRAFRPIHGPTGALIAAPGPRLAFLFSGYFVLSPNRGLDKRAVMGDPGSRPKPEELATGRTSYVPVSTPTPVPVSTPY